MRAKGLTSVIGLLVVGMVFGLILASRWETPVPAAASPQAARQQLKKQLGQGHNLSETFVLVSKIIRPSVVTLYTTAEISRRIPEFYFGPDEGRPFGPDFFERFFDRPRRAPQRRPREFKQKVSGLGSGLIISSDGYILTNNHVIEIQVQPGVGKVVDEIKVQLYDRRKQAYEAKLVGSDPKSDIAVIKIDADGLQPARLGNSSELEVGEWVLAAGAPFGLGHTISQGIISAFGRPLSSAPFAFSNFIQTTAIINPGSSGGPLVNLKGDVVGINSAIATSSAAVRGYQGVGFAIPIDDVKHIIAKLRKGEKIVRGYLGIEFGQVLERDVEDLKLDKAEGFLVSAVMAGSPAEQAGLKPGDVILKLNGKAPAEDNEFKRMVAQRVPGETVTLTISRQGKLKELKVKLVAQPEVGPEPAAKEEADTYSDEKLGIVVQSLTEELAESLGYQGRHGALVTEVTADSPADKAGVKVGDLIFIVNHQPVKSISEYIETSRTRTPSGYIVLRIRRKDEVKFIAIK